MTLAQPENITSGQSNNLQTMGLLGTPQVQDNSLFLKANPGVLRMSNLRPVESLKDALAYNETRGIKGNPYSFSQPSGSTTVGNALGKYQVTSARLKEKGQDFLGKPTTDQEFLSNPSLQDKFMDAQNRWLRSKGLTDEQIIATHRAGWGDLSKSYLTKVVNDRSGYVNNALKFLGE